MRFKLDLKRTDLDWNNPNILDYRYIDYLKNMIDERYLKAGFSGTCIRVGSNPTNSKFMPYWNTSYFYPNGILTYRELQTIYSMMLFLAIHGYMNKDKFKDENFKYGDNRVWWGYSLEDINAIANFDFTTHPFIPGQPIKYYEQFLKPIHDVLAALKYAWNNKWTYVIDGCSIETASVSTRNNSYFAWCFN